MSSATRRGATGLPALHADPEAIWYLTLSSTGHTVAGCRVGTPHTAGRQRYVPLHDAVCVYG
jgi:hypothetical protein